MYQWIGRPAEHRRHTTTTSIGYFYVGVSRSGVKMNKDFTGIYCIENRVNHKKYIGQSISIFKRWKQHVLGLNKERHYNCHLQGAWNKYGYSNFSFYILEICNRESLNEREKFWIAKLHTFGSHGYNQNSGGDNAEISDETKLKLSISFRGEKSTTNKYSQSLAEMVAACIYFRLPRGYITEITGTSKSFVDNIIAGKTWKNVISIPYGVHKARRDYVKLFMRYKRGSIKIDNNPERIEQEKISIAKRIGITLI